VLRCGLADLDVQHRCRPDFVEPDIGAQSTDGVDDCLVYRITSLGARIAVLYVRVYARAFRPAASLPAFGKHRGPKTLERLDAALTQFLQEVRLVA